MTKGITLQARDQTLYLKTMKGSWVIYTGHGESPPTTIGPLRFCVGDEEVLRFEGNGDVFVKCRKVSTDLEAWNAFRLWLLTAITVRGN